MRRHLNNVAPGGFGVTIFFFLSGYLITTLLRQEYEQRGAISFSKFYLRRIYRIIPPLYIVLLLLLLPWSRQGSHLPLTWGAVALQFAQLTNYYLIFGDQRHLIPDSGPTWSLGVEEHFYLLFPLALSLLLFKFKDYRRIGVALGAACAVVLAWRFCLFFVVHPPLDYTYYATDARIDSLLYGCIMGIALNPALDQHFARVGDRTWIGVLVLASALLGVSLLYRDDWFRCTLRYTVQGIALFPFFYCAVRKNAWPLFSWLESRPMRFMGLISYTFYLIHMKALVIVARYYEGPVIVQAILGFALAVAFSSAMYYLVEQHLGALRRRLHAPGRPAPRPSSLLEPASS
jgi:peptidoglycan/LPS O-acetylase OafA/YrhL